MALFAKRLKANGRSLRYGPADALPTGGGPATNYTVVLSASSGAPGAPVTMTVTPIGGSWPGGVVVTPSTATSTLTGSYSPTSASPTGTNAATFTWTPTSADGTSGTLYATTSPSMTGNGARSYTVATTAVWDALTPYSAVNRGFLNASSNTLVQPFATTLHFAQRGDIPAGSYPALFNGSTQLQTQVDLVAPANTDNSMVASAISVILPDTLTANGTGSDTGSYTIKAVVGTAPNTPKFSLATWAAANDLRVRFRTNLANLTDTAASYEFKVSDCIAAGIVEGVGTGSGYPLYKMRTDRSGPVCMGWMFGGYFKLMSSGATHREAWADVYVTAVTTTDMLIDINLSMPNAVETVGTRNAAQTIGPATSADLAPLVGVAELWNNGTKIKTWGGPTDYRASTVTIDTTNNQVVWPNSGSDQSAGNYGVHRPRDAMGYGFSSTGTLPTGLSATQPYFAYSDFLDRDRAYMFTSRGYQALAPVNAYQWAANTAFPTMAHFDYMYVGTAPVGLGYYQAQIWFAYQGGTTGTTPPSGTAMGQTDGTVIWDPVNAKMTTAGTGTLTAYPLVHIFQLCGTALCDDQTTQPVWTGSGPAPDLEPILDLTYHCRYARALPSFDLTISPIYTDGFVFDGHSVSERSFQQQIDNFGDNPGTNLVGYLNYTNALALIAQRDVKMQRYARSEALRWMDHWCMANDPRSAMPIVANKGPGNNTGTYTGLGPSMPTFYLAWPYKNASLVGAFTGTDGKPRNTNYYDAKYQKLVNPSHLPATWVLQYHKSARTIFLDQGLHLANTANMSNASDDGIRTVTFGGRTYSSSFLVSDQIRGMGWATRCHGTINDVLPVTHPMRAYLTDLVQDAIDCAVNMIADNQTNFPEIYHSGAIWQRRNGGWNAQHFFVAIYLLTVAQEARKNRNPGWRLVAEHVFTKYWLPIFNDAGAGNAGLVDWNNTFGCYGNYVSASLVSGDTITMTVTSDHGTNPAPIVYTVPSNMTPTQGAQAIVTFINAQSTFTAYGLVATYDTAQYFTVRAPGNLFNASNDHADAAIKFSQKVDPNIGGGGLQNSWAYAKPDQNGNVRAWFSTDQEMLDWNLGSGWPKSNTTQFSFSGTYDLPYAAAGWFPWGTVAYPVFVYGAICELYQSGITGADAVEAALTARFHTARGHPAPKFTGASSGQPGNGNRTFPNFAIRSWRAQAAYPNAT